MNELTTKQIAERFDVSIPTVTQWCRQGKFPHAWKPTERSTWLVPEKDLARFEKPKQGRPKFR